jgi:hypothetical protein
MLQNWQGKRLRANGFKSLAAVKAQFVKAGCVPGKKDDLEALEDNHFQWLCQCGAKLRFAKEGKTFNRLCIIHPPFTG